MNEKMNNLPSSTSSLPTPYELTAIALELYAQDHKSSDEKDDLGYTDYLPEALRLLVSAREFLKARERQEPPTS